ncbi:tannase/feruloyl esterase family alpha/beta hydrolase [Streptomyces sp. NPDC047046]|uniref:tannase/feruloyl esterase family alpha/beta hydrolase n=1 Tax=Streptomyces sp. NPDC047046 TaxID=3155378 RepID=UPI0033FD53A9
MRRLLTVLAASTPLVAAVYLPTASASTGSTASTTSASPLSAPTASACAAPRVQAPAGTKVENVTAVAHAAGPVDVPEIPPLGPVHVPDVPAFCDVTVTLTHPGQGDHAKVRVWLPAQKWNGRLQTLGGSAYAAGDYGAGLAGAVKNGYAAATTDAGVSTYVDSSWALDAQGKVNQTLLKNFASRSQHEAAVVAKEVVAGQYHRPASYAYFNGCSTGGREGYAEAQNYPKDYDGILANAPGINWDEFEVATLWPQVVMNVEKTFPTDCELNAFTAAAVKACDPLDGAEDGLVNDPDACDFDPRTLIGTKIDCQGQQLTLTAADAKVVRKIWDGPRTANGEHLWAGVPVTAALPGLAGTKPNDDGTRSGVPFQVPAQWVSDWVAKNPSLDITTITYERLAELFKQSEAEYDKVIGTDDPDLSAFRATGGKLLTWQGTDDQFIPAAGTKQYHERVVREMGSTKKTDDFYRFFLAPGTSHCGFANGIGSTDDLGALRTWVEHGKAPQTLPATLITSTGRPVTRDLCVYPQALVYKGRGDVADASSFRCATPHGRH